MKIKFFYCFILILCFVLNGEATFCQKQNDSLPASAQNQIGKNPTVTNRRATDTVNKEIRRNFILQDSNVSRRQLTVNPNINAIASNDSLTAKPDSLIDSLETLQRPVINFDSIILSKNQYINATGKPFFLEEQPHTASGKEFLFYSLCLILLILGLFRTFFTGYFKNLFRVYFNTSLRQTQLSDQIRQATLPSLILNIFFTITAGIYIWLLFNYYHLPKISNGRVLLSVCILSIGIIYFFKFCLLKFLGWVSDVQESTNGYIFAIFLVNKITGIFLVPVVILIAFVNPAWLPAIVNISFMIIGLLFLSRYVKSYGIIEKRIPLNPLHFLIYIAGAEILPMLILYKVAIDYLI